MQKKFGEHCLPFTMLVFAHSLLPRVMCKPLFSIMTITLRLKQCLNILPEFVVGEVQIAQGCVIREPRLVPRGEAVLAQGQNLYKTWLISESRQV